MSMNTDDTNILVTEELYLQRCKTCGLEYNTKELRDFCPECGSIDIETATCGCCDDPVKELRKSKETDWVEAPIKRAIP